MRNVSEVALTWRIVFLRHTAIGSAWLDRLHWLDGACGDDWSCCNVPLAREAGPTRGSRLGSYFWLAGGVPHLKSTSFPPFAPLFLHVDPVPRTRQSPSTAL